MGGGGSREAKSFSHIVLSGFSIFKGSTLRPQKSSLTRAF